MFCFMQINCLSKTFYIPGVWPVSGLVIVKKQIDISFYASVLLLKINVVITLSKFAEETLACGSWFHSHFDNVMTQFIINRRVKNWRQFVKDRAWHFPHTEMRDENTTHSGVFFVELGSVWKCDQTLSWVQMNIWKITYLNCGKRYEEMINHRSYTHNLNSCQIDAWKKY